MDTYRKKYFELTNKNPKIFTKEVVFSLFCDVFNISKEKLLLDFDKEIKDDSKPNSYVKRISLGEPYQYVIGYTYFLGHKFYVNRDVLIPRQETEQLVLDLAKYINESFDKEISLLDMCSGSGCIGISLKRFINGNVDMVDISNPANLVAKNNAILNKTKVGIFKSNLFVDMPRKKYDVIVSNPPYIKSEDTVDESTLKYEPHIALFASPYTFFYEEIFKAKDDYLNKEFILAFEIGEDMESDLSILVNKYFQNVEYFFKKDIYDKTRFLYIIKR